MRAALALAILSIVALPAQTRVYTDAARHFRFTYPASFGDPSPGTNDGFGDRVAALHFAAFSHQAIGGEAALTRGFPLLDLQAAGGLYDAITLEIFPDAARKAVLAALARLTPSTLCDALARETHLDPATVALPANLRTAIPAVDRMRNLSPRVHRCDVSGETVVFDKEVVTTAGGPRQHVYGAVRFLAAPDSTFQIIRGGPAPAALLLDQLSKLVESFERLP